MPDDYYSFAQDDKSTKPALKPDIPMRDDRRWEL